jgi:hypothetical protein
MRCPPRSAEGERRKGSIIRFGRSRDAFSAMLNENCELGPANILLHNYPMSNPALYAGKFHHHAKIARAPFPFVSQSDIVCHLLCCSPGIPVVGRIFHVG